MTIAYPYLYFFLRKPCICTFFSFCLATVRSQLRRLLSPTILSLKQYSQRFTTLFRLVVQVHSISELTRLQRFPALGLNLVCSTQLLDPDAPPGLRQIAKHLLFLQNFIILINNKSKVIHYIGCFQEPTYIRLKLCKLGLIFLQFLAFEVTPYFSLPQDILSMTTSQWPEHLEEQEIGLSSNNHMFFYHSHELLFSFMFIWLCL